MPSSSPAATFFRYFAGCLAFFLFIVLMTPLVLDAMEREADWRQERLCKYYGEEISAYAARNGEKNPC